MDSYKKVLESTPVFDDFYTRQAVYEMSLLPNPSGGFWQDEALCRVMSPDIFDDTTSHAPTIELAKRACALCVRSYECLDDALADRSTSQIYGGKTGQERRAILRKASRQRASPNR